MKFFAKLLWFIVLITMVFYGYARFVEPVLLTVKYENIESKLIKNKGNKIKIIQFSDVHISEFFDMRNLKKTVNKINAEKPDIVVFTGDLIDQYNKYENKENIDEIWDILSKINAPSGKYAIYGNHDYGGGAERAFKQIMENSGFQLLTNEKIKINEYNINIIGMDDSIFGVFNKELIISFLDENSFNIVLSHEPDAAEHFLEYSADLFLTGHSHGGQVNLPFINYTPPLAQKYKRGMYFINNYRQTKIYVNIGLGTSKIPMRFMAKPELTVFTLRNSMYWNNDFRKVFTNIKKGFAVQSL